MFYWSIWRFGVRPRGLFLIEDGMSKAPLNLAYLSYDVQAFIAAQSVELARKDAEIFELTHAAAQNRLKAAMAAQKEDFSKTIRNRDTIIADLRMQLDGHKKHRFGS